MATRRSKRPKARRRRRGSLHPLRLFVARLAEEAERARRRRARFALGTPGDLRCLERFLDRRNIARELEDMLDELGVE